MNSETARPPGEKSDTATLRRAAPAPGDDVAVDALAALIAERFGDTAGDTLRLPALDKKVAEAATDALIATFGGRAVPSSATAPPEDREAAVVATLDALLGRSTISAAPPLPPPPATPGPKAGKAPSRGRYLPGDLRRMIAQHLVDAAGADVGPADVSIALGNKGAHAILTMLEKMAGDGTVDQTRAAPRRYRANARTIDETLPGGVRAPAAPEPAPTPAPAPTPERVAVLPPGQVRRPGGGIYRTRQLGDLPDVEVLRKLRAARVPVLLYGPPGNGKTALVEAAFPDLITVPGDGDVQVSDLLGEYTQRPDGTYEFVYGPLVRAMLEGRPLFLDDCTLVPPSVLAVVYPAMDGRDELIVKSHKGETVRAAEGFYVVGGHNPGVHGAILTEALSSRFGAQVEVTADYDLAQAMHINRRAIVAARNLAMRVEKGEVGWAPMLRELIAFDRIEKVLGEDFAAANLLGVSPPEDRVQVASVLATTFGRTIKPLGLGPQV